MIVPAVNFHLLRPCNARCRFCFATFRDVEGELAVDEALRVVDALRDAGAEKLNFAGGEPTLHRHLGRLVAHAKQGGLVTSVVTNGFRLDRLLDRHAGELDWVGLSVDSAGRGGRGRARAQSGRPRPPVHRPGRPLPRRGRAREAQHRGDGAELSGGHERLRPPVPAGALEGVPGASDGGTERRRRRAAAH